MIQRSQYDGWLYTIKLHQDLLFMLEFNFVTLDGICRLIDGLPLEDQEALLAEKLKQLPTEAQSRVLSMSETGLAGVTGSVVSLNSDVSINIQSTTEFDPETVFRALAEYRKLEREKTNGGNYRNSNDSH